MTATTKPARTPALDRAYSTGYTQGYFGTGEDGGPAVEEYHPSTKEERSEWQAGYDAGTLDRADDLDRADAAAE